MALAHTYHTARDTGILYQGPTSGVFVHEQAELRGISTALADPDGCFPVLFLCEVLYYLSERAAGHWFLAVEPVAGLCRQIQAYQGQEHEFSHRNPL